MAPIALSSGTRALGFMKRAAIRNNEDVAELEQAKVRDEAEWDIGDARRTAWGISKNETGPKSSSSAVVYESSYLPFLLGNDDGAEDDAESSLAGPSRFSGRFSNLPVEETPDNTQKTDKQKDGSKPRANRIESDRASKQPEDRRLIAMEDTAERLYPAMSSQKGKKRKQPTDETDYPETPSYPNPSSSSGGFLRPAGIDAPPSAQVSTQSPKRKKKNKAKKIKTQANSTE